MRPESEKFLAKPTLDISLQEHTDHVVAEARAILASRPFVKEKYHQFTGKDMEKRVLTASKYHDVGKQHPRWQEACRKDHEIFCQTHQAAKMFHLRKANFRHEIASLLIDPKLNGLSDVVKAAIGAHHGKLSEDVADKWEDPNQGGADLWRLFKGIKNQVCFHDPPTKRLEEAVLKRYEYAGPRSYLQLADHRASAREEGQELPALKKFDYRFPHTSKRGVQHVIAQLQDEPFAILRAPTGSGKTDAALLWAQHQIRTGRADRLVMAMPTRFTANALSVSAVKNLSKVGLYHSSAWLQRLRNGQIPSTKSNNLILKEQQLARLLETPITVTTIDHLCISLTGTREDHHAIFFNLAHSCVVIDEADFYDEFTQWNIVVLLQVLRLLQVPVLLMSATVPDSTKEFFGQSGFTPRQIHEDNTDADRERYEIDLYENPVAVPDDCRDLLELAIQGPLIIYVNTVARAQVFYRSLKQWFEQRGYNQDNIILYHSRFTEPHKAEIENRLTENFGADAWKYGNAKGVAILTQIGELSVNISADMMISDMCPLDRLVQRAGRLSRFSHKIGKLYLIRPHKLDKNGASVFHPAPYGRYENRTWVMSEALKQSMNLISNGRYSSRAFVDLLNRLYPKPNLSPDDRVVSNSRELENLLISNWLILPADRLDEDDDETADWKSRDIEPQYTVYVDFDLFEGNFFFRNFGALREFQLLHGVQCYAHEFHHAREKEYIELRTFIVGDQPEIKLCLVRPAFYDSRLGLHFDEMDY